MFTTKIKIKEKEVALKFGSYVVQRMEENGVLLSEFAQHAKKPIGLTAMLVKFGAANANGFDEGAISEGEIYEWIDEVGIGSKEFLGVIELFSASLTKGVPTEKPKAAKK